MDDLAVADIQLDGWDLDLAFSAGRMSGWGASIEDIQLHARLGDGRLEFRPVSFVFAGGKVGGAVDGVFLNPSMVAKAVLRFERIPAAALGTLVNRPLPVEALFSGEMNLITEGQRFVDLAKALSGTVRLEAPGGMVIGLNDQHQAETARMAKVSAVLSAYGHADELSGQSDDLVRSFTLHITGDGLTPEVSGVLKTHGTFRLSSALDSISVSAEEFSARLTGQGLSVVSPLDLDGSGGYDSRAGSIFLDRFSFHGLGLTCSGRLLAGGLASKPQLSGHLKVDNFDPRVLAGRLGVFPAPKP